MRDCDQRLLLAQFFHIFEWDRFPLSTLLGELVKGRDFALVRVGEADYEKEIGVQVAIVECTRGGTGVGVVAEEDNIRGAGLDEKLQDS
jgi:hypothetical protein